MQFSLGRNSLGTAVGGGFKTLESTNLKRRKQK